jgi:hypothetical protein
MSQFTLSEPQLRQLANARIHFSTGEGSLIEIELTMQGHFTRFAAYLLKHNDRFHIHLIDYYKEGDSYVYYLGINEDREEGRGDKFFLQVFQNKLYFNISQKNSIRPVKNVFEGIKNHLDPKAALFCDFRRTQIA